MNLDELEKLLEQATPGPWSSTPSIPEEGSECFWLTACPRINQEREIAVVSGPQNERNTANAALIAALRNTAEELVRDARRYRDLMAAARQAVLALAHVSAYNPRYIRDYERLSDAIDAAIAQEQP